MTQQRALSLLALSLFLSSCTSCPTQSWHVRWKPPPELNERPVHCEDLDEQLARALPNNVAKDLVQAAAIVELSISPQGIGRPMYIRYESAPGFGEACARVLNGSKWAPATDVDGTPIPVQVPFHCELVPAGSYCGSLGTHPDTTEWRQKKGGRAARARCAIYLKRQDSNSAGAATSVPGPGDYLRHDRHFRRQ